MKKQTREKKLSKTKSQRYEIKVQKISRYQVSIIVQCSNMNERRFVRITHGTENMKLICWMKREKNFINFFIFLVKLLSSFNISRSF